MSLLTLSMRFCSVNSLDSVLSRKGALKVMFVGEAPELGMRIYSLRGGLRTAGLEATLLAAGGGDWGLFGRYVSWFDWGSNVIVVRW